MQRLIIDSDMASDDAVALLLALGSPHVAIEMISCVAGYLPIDRAVQNALYLLERAGRADIPVYAGASAPLIGPHRITARTHGLDGLGDIGLPIGGRTPADGDAVAALVGRARAAPGTLTVVALGPLTNLARAVQAEPRLPQLIKRCVVMGGRGIRGDALRLPADSNVRQDPHAAQAIFDSGLPLTLVGLDMCMECATFSREEAQAIARAGSSAQLAMAMQGDVPTFRICDALAMAVALAPEIAVTTGAQVHVALDAVDEAGMTDFSTPAANSFAVDVVTAVDRHAFVGLLLERLRGIEI